MGRIKKTYNKRKKSSLVKRKNFWIFLIILFSLTFFSYELFFNSFHQLEDITVEGVETVSESALEGLVRRKSSAELVLETSSLVTVSKKKIDEAILSGHPHIEKVDIKKVFPNRLEIEVTEREKEATWCVGPEADRECFEIDFSGVAFKRIAPNNDEFHIHLKTPTETELGAGVFPEKKIDFLFEARENLENDFGYEVAKMTIPHNRALFALVKEGPEIRFDMEDQLSGQLERLEILLKERIEDFEEVEYIELRYGSRIYYK